MFDPTGPDGRADAETYRVNERATDVSPKIGIVTNVSESSSGYRVQVSYNTATGTEQTEPTSVPVSKVGESRGIQIGTPVIIEIPSGGDRAMITNIIPTPQTPSVLTQERDYRITREKAVIEIVRNDYGQLMLTVGRLGDRQPDDQNVTRAGVDMGLMMNLSSGAFRLFDASGMGLSADGQGNFMWNWASMKVPNALYSGAGTSEGRGTTTTEDTTEEQDTSTYGGIGGGSSYTEQIPPEEATVTVAPEDDLTQIIQNASQDDVIHFTGEHDLSGNHATLSADNVTLASTRGSEGSTTGRIFDSSSVSDPNNGVLNVTGKNVLIDSLICDGQSSGINFKQGSTGEVANCKVDGFGVSGIGIIDSGPIETRYCTITNNEGTETGFGIRHENSNEMNIHEFNFYNSNTQAIKGNGRPGERFTARDSVFGETSHGPLISVSADENRDGNVAGDLYRILNNEMRQLPEQEQSVAHILGTPTGAFHFKNNWVHMTDKALAVKQSDGLGDPGSISDGSKPNEFQSVEMAGNAWGEKEPTKEVGPRV